MASGRHVAVQRRTVAEGSRLAGLDGLRAIAVLAVLCFHSDVLHAGYLGVDLFFVLSGFLITFILVREHSRTGTISFRAFWVRRAVRLLPAVYVYLAAGAVLVGVLKGPADQADYAANALTTVLNLGNWWRVHAPESGGAWAGHLWSLSIEQQFYLVWPLLIGLALRTARGARLLPWLLVLAVAAVVAWRILLAQETDAWARFYFGTDTRADSLLIGCLLAVLVSRGALRWVPAWSWTAAAMVAAALFAALAVAGPGLADAPFWMSRGVYTLAALLVAVVIGALLAQPDSVLARALTWRPLVWLGGVSYAFYLWHFPVVALLNAPLAGRIGPIGAVLVTAGISAIFAWASGRFVERPMARLRPRWATSPAMITGTPDAAAPRRTALAPAQR